MRIKELILTAPSFIWLFLFFLLPTSVIFIYAFKPYDLLLVSGSGWTLETVEAVFTHKITHIVWRTLWLSTVTTAICVAIAVVIGYSLVKVPEKVQKIFLLLVIMPSWSSFLIRVFSWKVLLHPEGFIRTSLVQLGIISEDTFLLYNIGTVLMVMVYSYLPFAIFPIYAQSVKFDYDLIEAAMDLGASKVQAFFSIFIPSIHKGIFTAIVMVFISAIGAYVIPDVVGGSQTEMLGNLIAQKVFTERNIPQASALSALLCFLAMLPLALVSSSKISTHIKAAR